ncbi:VanZ family protein [Streptomyces sp. NPDC059517]|uniref:VanZ family protein n=1 Tax=Streptomyces sp. NPDC059517 TaxID=3346855 RepID=UPI00367C4E99
MWRVVLYISPLTVTAFITTVAALTWLAARAADRHGTRAVRPVAQVLTLSWGLLVAGATLMPTQPPGTGDRTVWWIPGEGLWTSGANMLFAGEAEMIVRLQIANAAMFVPLAALTMFCLHRPHIVRATALSAAGSLLIEALQYAMAAGRVVDIDDLLLNTLGALIGASTAHLCLATRPHFHRSGTHRV